MPHSTHHPLTAVVEHLVRMQPRTILDVGPGYGKWGFLFREALDWMHDRHDCADWQVRIDALEAFETFSSPMYEWVYDEVRFGDVREVVSELPEYDLVMLGDIIEHLEKEEGMAVLRMLLAKSRNVIISTPVDFFTQEILNNPFEQHRSLWTISDFAEWTFDYDVIGHTTVVVALAGRGASYPRHRSTVASRAAYRLPGMSHQGLAAWGIKALVTRVPAGLIRRGG